MFELILTICMMGPSGEIQCRTPGRAHYVNETLCQRDAERGILRVMDQDMKSGLPVANVQGLCRPIGPTPKGM